MRKGGREKGRVRVKGRSGTQLLQAATPKGLDKVERLHYWQPHNHKSEAQGRGQVSARRGATR